MEYQKKLKKAIELIAQGCSIRAAAKQLQMDRHILSKHLKRMTEPFKDSSVSLNVQEPSYPFCMARIRDKSPLLDVNWYKRVATVVYDEPRVLEYETLPPKILAFSCTQFPYEKARWQEYLKEVLDLVQPDLVVMLGDLVDFKFLKKEFMHPDDLSPTEELERSAEAVNMLAKIVPQAIHLTSNHGEGRIRTAQIRGNIPSPLMRRWQHAVGVPDTWISRQYLIADDWLFEHGDGISKGSKASHRQDMISRFGRPLSAMRGHRHGEFGEITPPMVEAEGKVLRICYVGCLMDEKQATYTNGGLWNGCVALIHGYPVPIHMLRDFRTREWTGKINKKTRDMLNSLK